MPSHYDTTYNHIYSKPVYDTDADRRKYEALREADAILKLAAPREPTQREENEYMEFLEKDMRSDPWVTYRARKFTAGPKRIPWKNQRELKRTYQYNFCMAWALGFAIAWPVASVIGRRMRVYQGGVPVVPYQRWVHDFPNLEPSRAGRLQFRWYSILSSGVLGFLFARYTVDSTFFTNPWYNRPDLKPYPAMVNQDENPNALTEQTVKEIHYNSYRNARKAEDRKRSAWYRYFFALDADFSVKENPYVTQHPKDVYNREDMRFVTYSNRFSDHTQD